METKRLAVSIVEAARMIGVCTKTVHNLIRLKELPSRKIGRRRVILVKDLETFLRRDHEIPDAADTVWPADGVRKMDSEAA